MIAPVIYQNIRMMMAVTEELSPALLSQGQGHHTHTSAYYSISAGCDVPSGNSMRESLFIMNVLQFHDPYRGHSIHIVF